MQLNEKAQTIRLLVLDVDGVMTPGIIYYGTQDIELRGFHVHDGIGIKLLHKAGIKVAVITAKKSPIVIKRLEDLHIEHVYMGYEDKRPAYEDLKSKLGLSDKEIAYMGDDLPDLPVLIRAQLAFTVPQAPDIIKEHVDYITKNKGGKGAVREVCELLLKAQHKYESMVQFYLDK